MSKNNKEVRDFLDNIHDSKFKSFVSSEKTIVEDKKRGMFFSRGTLPYQSTLTGNTDPEIAYRLPLRPSRS